MHYQLLKQVMRNNGLGILLDDPLHGNHVREVLRSSVLFTDMGVHNDFMAQFKKIIDGEAGTLCQRQTMICQAILKNADISNPVCSLTILDACHSYLTIFFCSVSAIHSVHTLGKSTYARMDSASES